MYTCLLVSKFEKESLKAKRRLKILNKFPKVSSLISMNTLLILPHETENIFPFIKERCRKVERGKRMIGSK